MSPRFPFLRYNRNDLAHIGHTQLPIEELNRELMIAISDLTGYLQRKHYDLL